MPDALISALTLAAAVGAGLNGGLFFVFSTFMMTVLGQLPPAQGITAMQGVNRRILNPLFGLVFGGTTVICLFLVVVTPFSDQPGGGWRLGGALLLVLGMFAVTMVFNVPLNNALDAADAGSADGVTFWRERYLFRWTAWNHLRTFACTGAAVALTIAYGATA